MTTAEITITKAETSKLKDLNLENIPFGKYFSDHMLEADYENGEWKNVEIKPYQPLLIAPSNAAWHYGQSIFEGIKAFKHENGEAFIFRPHDNFKRFNISAERMQMPQVPEEIFMEGMRKLIELDKSWIPSRKDHSLYIRPFMFATDEVIGVRPSENYKFMIILSPTGPYYTAPMRIYVEEQYVRAVPGGVGYAKASGNYAGAMKATIEAKAKGYDQVLWTDGKEDPHIEESGMMNVMFVINDTLITAPLSDSILDGVTRDSLLTLANHLGYKTEERQLSVKELADAFRDKTITEAFGAGTAAVVAPIGVIHIDGMDFYLPAYDKESVSNQLKNKLERIRSGTDEDLYGWNHIV